MIDTVGFVSDLQEDLPAIKPETNQPKDQQDGRILENGTIDGDQFWGFQAFDQPGNGFAQMDIKAVSDKTAAQLGHAVDGDGIHPDDNKRKSPVFPSYAFDYPKKEGKHQECPACAVNSPRWGPDSFHDWANGIPHE